MSDEHAPIAPSGLSRVIKCPGSLVSSRSERPQQDTSDAELGNVAHELAAHILKNETFDHALIDSEMRANVKIYTDFCKSLNAESNEWVEERAQIPQIHPTDCWGTFDFGCVAGRVLHIVDLKYGYKWVDVFNNTQLIPYGGGVLHGLSYTNLVSHVHIHIVQPRANHKQGPIRSQLLTRGELDTQLAFIKSRVDLALGPNPELTSGSHCYRCPSQYNCAANNGAADNAIDLSLNYNPDLNALTMHKLGSDMINIERAQELLKERLISVKEVLQYRIKNGEQSTTHESIEYLGNRAWSKSEQEIKTIGAFANIKLTEEKLLSPAKAEKAGLPKKTVNSMVSRPTFYKLKPINFEKIKEEFICPSS